MQPETFQPKTLKSQMEEWWGVPFIVDPLKPACWRIDAASELTYHRDPVVLDQDDGGPLGPEPAI
jgi:hypothetical protein